MTKIPLRSLQVRQPQGICHARLGMAGILIPFPAPAATRPDANRAALWMKTVRRSQPGDPRSMKIPCIHLLDRSR
jgi:hypothetical protein